MLKEKELIEGNIKVLKDLDFEMLIQINGVLEDSNETDNDDLELTKKVVSRAIKERCSELIDAEKAVKKILKVIPSTKEEAILNLENEFDGFSFLIGNSSTDIMDNFEFELLKNVQFKDLAIVEKYIDNEDIIKDLNCWIMLTCRELMLEKDFNYINLWFNTVTKKHYITVENDEDIIGNIYQLNL